MAHFPCLCNNTQDDKILTEFKWKLLEDIYSDWHPLIDMYEHIRGLGRFDKDNCPILEIQTNENRNYFLQYHKTKNSDISTFTIDRVKKEEEIEATFVRGATGREGIQIKTNVYNSYLMEKKKEKLIELEEGAIDIHYNSIFKEIMPSRRIVQFLESSGVNDLSLALKSGHLFRSRLFKPKITIAIPKENMDSLLIDKAGNDMGKIRCQDDGSLPFINLHIVSDGRKAFIKGITQTITILYVLDFTLHGATVPSVQPSPD